MQMVVGCGDLPGMPCAGLTWREYTVADVRGGVVVRELARAGWMADLPDMEALQGFVGAHGAVEIAADPETDAHLCLELLDDALHVAAPRNLFRGLVYRAAKPARVAAMVMVAGLLIDVIDRLNIIPGF